MATHNTRTREPVVGRTYYSGPHASYNLRLLEYGRSARQALEEMRADLAANPEARELVLA